VSLEHPVRKFPIVWEFVEVAVRELGVFLALAVHSYCSLRRDCRRNGSAWSVGYSLGFPSLLIFVGMKELVVPYFFFEF
jgi:hypothetical protein